MIIIVIIININIIMININCPPLPAPTPLRLRFRLPLLYEDLPLTFSELFPVPHLPSPAVRLLDHFHKPVLMILMFLRVGY